MISFSRVVRFADFVGNLAQTLAASGVSSIISSNKDVRSSSSSKDVPKLLVRGSEACQDRGLWARHD
jgi:hypothetical protein